MTAALYLLLFLFYGRPENEYWGALYAPLVAFGPSPSLKIKKPSGADDNSVTDSDRRKRYRLPGGEPLKRGVDILDSLGLPTWDRTPLVKRRVGRRCGRKPFGVAELQRFESNVAALQHGCFERHALHYAGSSGLAQPMAAAVPAELPQFVIV